MISGDVFFVVHLGGFTVRIYQFLLIPVLLKGMLEMFQGLWPVGFGKLLVWTIFIVLFIPNTSLIERNVFYALWLVSSVLMVLGITASVDTPEKLQTILRWYTYSFAFSAIFGLVQLILPLVGLPGPLVQEWWIHDKLARINGFTYEPSYFATYMITGWVMIDYLRYKKFHFRYLNLCFWLITLALVLCSSRAGWIAMGVWVAIRAFWHLRAGTVPWRQIGITLAAAALVVAGVMVVTGLEGDDFMVLTAGMGVVDEQGSFSAEGRWDTTIETLQVYADHPIIGVSLGGVATEIAHQNGYDVVDNEDAKTSEGLCTTAEVLAASGTIGFIFYVLYMVELCRGMFRLSTGTAIAGALGWGLILLLFILQTDQNILRGYVWFHISILSAAHHVLADPVFHSAAQETRVLTPSASTS